MTAHNANSGLKRLADSGAVHKTQVTDFSRGGKEFVYEAVSSETSEVNH